MKRRKRRAAAFCSVYAARSCAGAGNSHERRVAASGVLQHPNGLLPMAFQASWVIRSRLTSTEANYELHSSGVGD